MKYFNILFLSLIFVVTACSTDNKVIDKRAKHTNFLAHSPFAISKNLSREARKDLGMPPNKYLERQWELTMNPEKGRPTTEKLHALSERLRNKPTRLVPGDAGNAWVERGPNNVGGRTKALLFDPNDATHHTVFAGGISGGLWKNIDITNANSDWTLVDIPQNLSVSSITVDPNNSQVFYVGTGESYTGGAVNGNGIWKSTDAGTTWQHVFGGISGQATYETNANLHISTPVGLSGDFFAVKSAFGPDFNDVTGTLILVDDGSSDPTLGCGGLTNAASINGNIAVIERGTCYFTEKVINAQNAGAIGVLMINNVDGYPIIMGGTDTSITTPAIMISKSDGAALLTALQNAQSIQATLTDNHTDIANGFVVPGITHINDVIARNNNGATEIFATAGDTYFRRANPYTVLGTGYQGLFKSADNGLTWTKINLPLTSEGNPYTPFDLELGADNKVWFTTTTSPVYGTDGAGSIFYSADGTNFTLAMGNNTGRTELAASKTDPNKFYAIMVSSSLPYILKTTDAFASVNATSTPNGSSTPANDFTNGQSYYDLAIEVSPNNDEIVFVGGIDWFKSINGGNAWSQISYGYGGGTYLHPDQHGIVFADANHILFGNDGGVGYSSNGGTSMYHRNKNYNTVQFYHMAVAPSNVLPGENFVAGAQDNGTQMFENAPAGISGSFEAQGGDGAYCFFDQDGTDKYRISNYVYNNRIRLYNYQNSSWSTINYETTDHGDFINQEALDSHLNILYANYTTYATAGNTYQLVRYANLLGSVQKAYLQDAAMNRPPSAFKVSPFTTSSSKLFVGLDNGKLFKVLNANTASYSFVEITGNDFLGSVSDIEFGQTENDIFVTMSNYGVNNVFYSSDAGNTWVQKDNNLPDLPVNCILQNPLNRNQVIIGTDLGTWWTGNFNDASPIWTQGSNGMNTVRVTDMEMRDDYKVYASTYGRGVFSSQFTAATSSLDETLLKSIKVYPNPIKDILNISIMEQIENPKLSIFDVSGKQVYTKQLMESGKNYKINIGFLSSGNYILKLQSKNKTFTKKLLKE